MTIKETLEWSRLELIHACQRPLYEAEILLAYHLKWDRIKLKINDKKEVEDLDTFKMLVSRRAKHEPMEYIIAKVSFYDIELFIKQGALIPRPETEILIDECASIIRACDIKTLAEIGVGSGAISIVLARIFPHLHIIASDISKEALEIAKANIDRFGLSDRIELRHTSLLDDIRVNIDMVVSNPPYIARGTPLAPNVAQYEPHTALYSLDDGDELLKEIILLTKKRNIKYLACEMGYDQKESLGRFMSDEQIPKVEFYQDLAGLDRGFVATMVSP